MGSWAPGSCDHGDVRAGSGEGGLRLSGAASPNSSCLIEKRRGSSEPAAGGGGTTGAQRLGRRGCSGDLGLEVVGQDPEDQGHV